MSDTALVGIVDYGAGNILNVVRAFEAHQVAVELVSDPDSLERHSHIVLPGVGSFDYGMKNLTQSGLSGAIVESARAGKPILGICLGMQLLAQRGFENGQTEGLGLIEGEIVHLKHSQDPSSDVRIPHTGWSALSWKSEPSHNLGSQLSAAYFNHSYFLNNAGHSEVVATATLGAGDIPVAIRSGSIFATQFHPEKSGSGGVDLLREWLRQSSSSRSG